MSKEYGFTYIGAGAYGHLGDVHYHLEPELEIKRKCQHLLKTSDYEKHKDEINEKAPQTCRWVLDHPLFQQWLQGSVVSILWISADPYCGKSVFVRSLLDEDSLGESETSLCYFFFKSGAQEQDNLANALSALLHQLFKSQPCLLRHAVAEWLQIGARLPQETSALWRVLCNAANDTEARPVVYVVDALDECQEYDRRRLVKLIGDFYAGAKAQQRRDKTKFLLTSRPDTDMQTLFEPYTRIKAVVRLHGELENDKIREEVDSVVRRDIDRWAANFGLCNSHRELLRFRLSQMQQRTYLWWKLVRDDVCDAYRDAGDPNDVMVDDIVRRLPSSVENAYEKLLQRLTDQSASKAKGIFSIMLAACRPLTMNELAGISTVLASVRRSGFPRIKNDERRLETLRRWCGTFVFVNHDKLYFIHTTAREFLLRASDQSEHMSNTGNWGHSIALHHARETLAIAAYGQLQYHKKTLAKRSRDLTTKQKLREDDGVFLDYASRYASYHAAEATRYRNATQGRNLITRFCSFGMNLETVDADGRSLLHHLVLYEYSSHAYAMIEAVLEAGGLVQTADRDNMHVLQHAIRWGDNDVMSLLLKHGFPVNKAITRRRIMPQHAKIGLTDPGIGHNQLNAIGLTALHAAVLYGRPKELSQLIRAGVNVRINDENGSTALHTALALSLPQTHLGDAWEVYEQMPGCISGDDDEGECSNVITKPEEVRMQVLSLLCEEDPALVRYQDNNGRTGLHLIRYDNCHYLAEDAINLLLRYGADPKAKDKDGITPMHLAAESGRLECFRILTGFTSTSMLDVLDNKGRNCLHFASKAPNQQTVKYILADADNTHLVNTVDAYGQSPLHISLFDEAHSPRPCRALPETVETLLLAGAQATPTNHRGQDALAHYLVSVPFSMEQSSVRMLLEHGANASFQQDGENLAHILVQGWNPVDVETLHVLHLHGVPLDALDNDGRNILHNAAIAGTISAEFLHYLHNVLDFAAQDDCMKTAFTHAQEMARQEQHPDEYCPERWQEAIACLTSRA